MSFKRLVRAGVKAVGATGPALQVHEWLQSWRHEKPPARDLDGLPIPSRPLMMQVAGTADWKWFLSSGEATARKLAAYAKEGGCDPATASHILDFGCGSGRIARHLHKLTSATLTGVDYNPALVRWCARNLPGEYSVNRLKPPSRFADATFDIIYLYSILTHLRLDTQLAWMREFARIARPGGVVLASFHDEDQPSFPDDSGARQRLGETGFHIHNDMAEGPNFVAAFPTRDLVLREFGKLFEVVRIIPSNETALGQAMAILRRPV